MKAEQKIEKIAATLSGIDPCDMTEMELNIRNIVEEKNATSEERIKARKNTSAIMEN